MPTKIDDIKEAINTKLATALTGYKRIPNPYSLVDVPSIILNKSYGVVVGSGTNTQRYVGCLTSWEREFIIGIVTQITKTENDTEGREGIEIDILDAHRAVLQSFETDPSMSGVVIKAIVLNDGGLNYIDGPKGKYLAMELVLGVEYQEQL
jgi:hypothetical protein